jgi:hypothetical protein
MRLWVDDIRKEPEGWTRAKTVTEAIRILDMGQVDEVSLDHDISYKVSIGHGDARPFCAPETFEPVARFIAARFRSSLPVTLHTANAVAAERMKNILEGFPVTISLSKPCNRFEEEGE